MAKDTIQNFSQGYLINYTLLHDLKNDITFAIAFCKLARVVVLSNCDSVVLILTLRQQKIKVQTCPLHMCSDGWVQGAYGILGNPSSDGSSPRGTSTNLFLSSLMPRPYTRAHERVWFPTVESPSCTYTVLVVVIRPYSLKAGFTKLP